MSALVGEWHGYFAYPDGPKRDMSLNIDKAANTVFTGTGSEARGAFNIKAGLCFSASEGSATIVTFAQEYQSMWPGQIWSHRGTLSADGNTLSGEWYDSPADGRNRVGTWSVTRGPRGPISPLSGTWSGTYWYPTGSSKDFTLAVEPFTVGSSFKGKGNDGAWFSVEGTVSANGAVSWRQTYDSQWQGQVWFWNGVLNENEIRGNWQDSSNDGRNRTAAFVLNRA